MMRNIALKQSNYLSSSDADLITLGQAANHFASQNVFQDYRARKAKQTLRRQEADLALFAEFIRSTGVDVGDLANDAAAWQGVTWGLVAAFMQWQLKEGYAVSSANVRLSTVKGYAKLAFKAGALKDAEYALISAVEGFSHKEGKHIDEQRKAADISTRVGSKKAEAVSLTSSQAKALKDQPDTPVGRRDRLLMCLMLDHGLRVGEVEILEVENFDLEAGELRFYRPKVDKLQTHKLTADTLKAARAYLEQDAPKAGIIWRGSRKGKGGLQEQGMSARAITNRVRDLGKAIGVSGLSAHDCRHYWATRAARKGTQVDRLQDAGGWSSPAMPLRYVQAAKIANEGIILD